MPLIEQFEASGNWLFRWRSYIPLILLVLFLAGLSQFHYPFQSPVLDEAWEVVCILVAFLGLGIRVLTIGYTSSGTSGRNTKEQLASELNTTGMYSIVRNPLYLGNFMMMLGPVLFLRVWWVTTVFTLLFALYYERIIFAEEMFLRRKFGDAYVEWASRVPAFFPRFRQWESPRLPFSWRMVIRREYHGAFGVIMTMFGLETLSELYMDHRLSIDTMWIFILAVSATAYATIRFLHKRTSILRTQGR